MKRILSFVLILILSIGVLAACQTPETDGGKTYDLENAKGALVELYPQLVPTTEIPVPSTLTDFRVPKTIIAADGNYKVAWTTNNESVKIVDYVPKDENDKYNAENSATVDLPSLGANEVTYSITATITAPDGTSTTVTFNLMIPSLDFNTHDEYMAAEKDSAIKIKGIVVAINSVSLGNKYNHIFIADETKQAGYYCYKLAGDPAELGVKVGMTVLVSGVASPYSGMQELTGGEIAILDESIKTVDVYDVTEDFANGTDFGAYVGLPVVIKGVEIGAQDLEKDTSQYLYFSLNGRQGYVRTYVTDFPAGMLAASDKDAIDADHAAHFGWKADVTGIVVLYNGNPYLIPISATPFTNYVEVVKTPAEKVEAEKNGISIETSFSSDATATLPLVGQYYNDVTISWTSDNENIVIGENGAITVTVPDTKTIVKLTATITCGDATDTKEIEVTLNKTITPIKDANEIGAAKEHNTQTEEKYLVAGVVTQVVNTQYGNLYISNGVIIIRLIVF